MKKTTVGLNLMTEQNRTRHIAFNACNSSLGGVVNYVELMASEFPKYNEDCHFTIFLSKDLEHIEELANTTIVFLDTTKYVYKSRIIWEQILLPIEIRKRGIDLLYTFFATDVVLASCPTVIRIGNMAPYDARVVALETELVPRVRLKALRLLSKLCSKTADATIVQSRYAAAELIEKSGFSPVKTKGLNRGYEVENLIGDGSSTRLVDGEFVLCVSHILRYKLLSEVIEGYSIAKKKLDFLPKLVIPGAFKDQAYLQELEEQIEKLQLNENVILLGNVARENLFQMIQDSSFCIFSSLVETFPTTLLEKMSLGKALIVSDKGVMPHFCGDSALLYDPFDAAELAEHLINCTSSPTLVTELERKALNRFKELDLRWVNAFHLRRELFLSLMN